MYVLLIEVDSKLYYELHCLEDSVWMEGIVAMTEECGRRLDTCYVSAKQP